MSTSRLPCRHFFLVLTLLVSLFYTLDKYWLRRQCIFSSSTIQSIAQSAIAQHSTSGNSSNTTTLLQQVHSSLHSIYGSAIIPSYTCSDWFFNNAGGAMTSVLILHALLTEYLIFVGTAIGTEGHSGVHLAEDYFTILVGEQRIAHPHDLGPIVFEPGDQNHLKRGDAFQFAMPGKCYAIGLAQGWIPAMMQFGFADTLSSTFDWGNMWKTVRLTVREMGRQAMRGKL